MTSHATLHSAPYNACISAFHLAYDCNSPLPTQLYLSQRWRYPFGFNVTVTPQPSCNVTLPQQNAGVSRVCVRHALCLTPPLQCTSCALRVTALKCLCKRARGGSSACSVLPRSDDDEGHKSTCTDVSSSLMLLGKFVESASSTSHQVRVMKNRTISTASLHTYHPNDNLIL